ncbi:carboxylic ester hydrolase [Elysia marginata]|uniref:Carboxylic ester hydrolase n=1 Tax=Elysia marginata TaxID=1093978 RepID=A0AAV4I663_9GAST|nr:carboxylic ester hydrolase [Elysia marginata]
MSRVGYSVLSSPKPANDEFFPLPSRQFARFLRDIKVVCPSKIFADKLNILLADTAPVYHYISEAFPSQNFKLEKSISASPSSTDLFIGWDMVAFFGSFRELGYRERQGDISFQDIVRQELLSLARTGKPNAARWHTEEINTGILRSEVTVSPAPANYFDSCEILQQFGFFRYSWTKS